MEYTFIPASNFSLFTFLVLAVITIGTIIYGAYKVDRSLSKKISIFLLIWIAVLSAVVQSGVLKDHLIPAVPMFFAFIGLGAVFFGMSPWGLKLATLPIWTLVLFQCFRLPLELILHSWATQGTIPATMTWTGQNFDIITGLLALVVIFKPLRNQNIYWIFNSIGFLLLLNVLRVAVMSSPLPFSWNLDNPLQLVLYMPYALIGFVFVWSALAGHIILTRALLRNKIST